jgi:hypothetical protein
LAGGVEAVAVVLFGIEGREANSRKLSLPFLLFIPRGILLLEDLTLGSVGVRPAGKELLLLLVFG